MQEREPFPDAFLFQLGRVIVQWNDLEFALNLLLNYLAGSGVHDYRGLIIFAHMAFPQKTQALAALLKATPSFANAYRHHNLSQITGQIEAAATVRNVLIHSNYSAENGVIVARTITARNKLDLKQRTMHTDQVAADADRIVVASKALYALIQEIDPTLMAAPQEGQ